MGGLPRVGKPKRQTGNMFMDSSLGLADQTAAGLFHLNRALWKRNSVRPSLIEMMRLRNARTVNCVFCKSVRYDLAREDGLTEGKAALIDDGFDRSDLTGMEKLVLRFADTYLRAPGNPSPELIGKLQEHFSGEQIAHLAIALATFNSTSKCAVSLGGMPDSLPITEVSFASSFGADLPAAHPEAASLG